MRTMSILSCLLALAIAIACSDRADDAAASRRNGGGGDSDSDSDADTDSDSDGDGDADGDPPSSVDSDFREAGADTDVDRDTDPPSPDDPDFGEAGTDDDDDGCAGVSQTAKNTKAPVDIIIAVDTSSSMGPTRVALQEGLGSFAEEISNAGIDAHIILIASTFPNSCQTVIPGMGVGVGICIPKPLGSGECDSKGSSKIGHTCTPGETDLPCPATEIAGVGSDSSMPNFLHLNTAIGGGLVIDAIFCQYPQYKHMLRKGVPKQIIIAEDSQAAGTPKSFTDRLAALDPPIAPDTWTFNAVYCRKACSPSCLLAFQNGLYANLIKSTGGADGLLCNARQAFDALLDSIAESVIVNSPLECEWKIPEVPEGQVFDKGMVNVKYTSSEGEITKYGKVEGDCGKKQGWYYDDEGSPTKVKVCPATCDRIQEDQDAKIDIVFGCRTKLVV